MDNEGSHQRSRTRWTPSLDKIFADLVVKQIKLGNRPNNIFDKKTWSRIRDEFNMQTDLHFNNNQLRKHLDVLRTRFYNLKSTTDQNDFSMEDTCCIGFDLWEEIGTQTRPEPVKIKDCAIYEQLCTIFSEPVADGKFAQSSHYEELGRPTGIETGNLNSFEDGEIPSLVKFMQGSITSTTKKGSNNTAEKRKKHAFETRSCSVPSKREQEINDVMAEAMSVMLVASRQRTVARKLIDDKFSISSCIRALDEMGDLDEQVYFAALDMFEDSSLRETFICLKGKKIRMAWLHGKCGGIGNVIST